MQKNPLSRRYFLELTAPTEEDQRSEKQRILDALPEDLGSVAMSLSSMRELYPVCQEKDWRLTAILSWNGTGWEITGLEPGDTTRQNVGVCADLGSTTVCIRLIDLNDGHVICQESAYNRQIAFGEDILNRVFYSKGDREKLEEIRKATIETFCEVLSSLEEKSGICLRHCGAMTLAGNTTMMHFFYGLDAFAVFASPYAPRATKFEPYTGESLGLPFSGYVYAFPCRANYLGGDIISGLVATGLTEEEEICVFLDIGTNGELVVGNRHFLMAGAGAAGPALEGGVVKTGMRAVEGAVSYVKLEDGKFHLTVIGGGAPKGLCGSGIVDLIAQLFLHGMLDIRGKFIPEAPGLETQNGELCVQYAPGLYFFQSDVEAFLRTKAAANTMVEIMLDELGVPMDAVSKFYVAGAFGTYLDKESAVTIGLYPDMQRERIISAGNTSLDGAQILLSNKAIWDRLDSIVGNMEYIQFGAVANFIDRMVAARAIPHTDMNRYPSVRDKLVEAGLLR